MKTATEILTKEITIPCYLCGKGKIKIRARDIGLNIPHPLDAIIRADLEGYLLKKTKEYMNNLYKKIDIKL